MKTKHYDEIVLCHEDFGDDLWNVVAKQLEILTGAGYTCRVHDDECSCNIIVIDFAQCGDDWPTSCEFIDDTREEIVAMEEVKSDD